MQRRADSHVGETITASLLFLFFKLLINPLAAMQCDGEAGSVRGNGALALDPSESVLFSQAQVQAQ